MKLSLETLKQLSQLVASKKLLTPANWKKESKYSHLFNLLCDEDLDLQKIPQALGYTGIADRAFYRLCLRYEEKVSDLLLVIDLPAEERTEIAIGANKAVKDYMKAYELYSRNMIEAASYFNHKAYNQANRYTLTPIRFLTVSLKISRLATVAKFGAEYKKLKKELQEIKQIEAAELQIIEYQARLSQILSKKTIKRNKEELLEIKKDVKHLQENFFSYKVAIVGMLIKNTICRVINNHEEILTVCANVRRLLTNRKLTSTASEYLIDASTAGALIALQRFDEAIDIMLKPNSSVYPGGMRYFTQGGRLFTCYIYTKQYQKAWELTLDTLRHDKGVSNYKKFIEAAMVKKALLQLFFEMKKKVGDPVVVDAPKMTRHSLVRLLNDLTDGDKDKAGRKTTAIILELLFAVVKKEYDTIIDKEDATRLHIYRYLKGTQMKRDKLFISMLIDLPKTNMNQRHINNTYKSKLNQLMKSSVSLNESFVDTEIIPYETLWELIVKTFPK